MRLTLYKLSPLSLSKAATENAKMVYCNRYYIDCFILIRSAGLPLLTLRAELLDMKFVLDSGLRVVIPRSLY